MTEFWVCEACKSLVRGNADVCYKCRTPRPQEARDVGARHSRASRPAVRHEDVAVERDRPVREDRAVRDAAQRNVEALLPSVQAGCSIVVPQPTCAYTIKDEYPAFLGTDAARKVAAMKVLPEPTGIVVISLILTPFAAVTTSCCV